MGWSGGIHGVGRIRIGFGSVDHMILKDRVFMLMLFLVMHMMMKI
jgi:hypothetical protein